jgi:hypothetical protein
MININFLKWNIMSNETNSVILITDKNNDWNTVKNSYSHVKFNKYTQNTLYILSLDITIKVSVVKVKVTPMKTTDLHSL